MIIRLYSMNKLKIFLSIILVLFFGIYMCAQNVNVYDKGELNCNDSGKYCTTKDGTPVTGVVKSYYESSALKSEVNWKDGMQNGIGKWYYENGNLEEESNWKDGEANGVEKIYYESGALKCEINWKYGKRNGIAKWYYEDGNLKVEANYVDGKVNGIIKRYDKSGNLISDKYKDSAICIGAAIQALSCAANSAYSLRVTHTALEVLKDCFNSDYPSVSSNDFLEYFNEGKNMVARVTDYCNYVPPAIVVVNEYCRNEDKLDKCLSQKSFVGDTVSDIVYTYIDSWR